MSRLKRLINEAHRRSLWQVLLIYVGAGWVVFEIVQTVTEGLGLPQWFPAFAALLLLIGLPVVLATAFVREGEPGEAIRYATQLEARAARLESGEGSARAALSRDFALTVRAQVAALRGDPGEALRLLERTRRREWWTFLPWSPLFSGTHERYLRAEVLDALGRGKEALDWYASLGSLPADVPYPAPAHLRRAEIYERLGEREEAVRHYSRFIQLWQDCDPELRPLLEGASRELARLTGER